MKQKYDGILTMRIRQAVCMMSMMLFLLSFSTVTAQNISQTKDKERKTAQMKKFPDCLKNASQAPRKMPKVGAPRKAPITDISQLAGPAVIWSRSVLDDIESGGNSIEITKLNSTTLEVEHFTPYSDNKIRINVNLSDGTFTIPSKQVLWTDEEDGDYCLCAITGGSPDVNSPISGYIDEYGDLAITTGWADIVTIDGKYYYTEGIWSNSYLTLANAKMEASFSTGKEKYNVVVAQSEDNKTVLALNFGGYGQIVEIEVAEGNSVTIPSQCVYDVAPGTDSDGYPIDDYYSYAANLDGGNYLSTDYITGGITSKEISFGNWAILWDIGNGRKRGYWYNDGKITITDPNDYFSSPGNPKTVLTVNDMLITEGGTADLVVNMDYNTSETVVGYNFSLYLPDGVEVAKDDEGELIAEASSELHSYALRQGLDIFERANGSYLFVCIKDKIPMTGTHGKLVTIKLKATKAGGGTATIKDIVLVNEKNEQLDYGNLKDVEFNVNVIKATLVEHETDLATFTLNPASKMATIKSVKANYKDVEVPSTVEYNGEQYTVSAIGYQALASDDSFNLSVSLPSTITTIEAGAFDYAETSAIIWNSNTPLPSNAFDNIDFEEIWANMLLYVNKNGIAPSGFANTIVNGTAQNIQLKEGYVFHCPQEFTARNISFTHEFTMETVIDKRQGWETIALPFDVQTITHATKGYLVPFASYTPSSTDKPFWLYEWTSEGFAKASAMVANEPYIISMPNNAAYSPDYNVAGVVTFAASNAQVHATTDISSYGYNNKFFFATYYYTGDSEKYPTYSINSVNNLHSNIGGYDPGSKFIRNKQLRNTFPFEGYIEDRSNASSRSVIEIEFAPEEDEVQGIETIAPIVDKARGSGVYSLSGQYLGDDEKGLQLLPSGVYIVNGKKKIVR